MYSLKYSTHLVKWGNTSTFLVKRYQKCLILTSACPTTILASGMCWISCMTASLLSCYWVVSSRASGSFQCLLLKYGFLLDIVPSSLRAKNWIVRKRALRQIERKGVLNQIESLVSVCVTFTSAGNYTAFGETKTKCLTRFWNGFLISWNMSLWILDTKQYNFIEMTAFDPQKRGF